MCEDVVVPHRAPRMRQSLCSSKELTRASVTPVAVMQSALKEDRQDSYVQG
jgi:hypothetical protein